MPRKVPVSIQIFSVIALSFLSRWATGLAALPPVPFELALAPGCEHSSKPCLAAHHLFVAFCHALQRKYFSHSPHASEDAEGERILRIDGVAGGPAYHGTPPSDEKKCVHL